jgi:hypothetical protein
MYLSANYKVFEMDTKSAKKDPPAVGSTATDLSEEYHSLTVEGGEYSSMLWCLPSGHY